MKGTAVMLVLVFAAVSVHASGFRPLEGLISGDIPAVCGKTEFRDPPAPVKPDPQLLHRFDRLKNDVRSLKDRADAARHELYRLQSSAGHIAASGSSHLAFQNDMLRLSSDLNRYAGDARNMLYEVTNTLPLAVKDRELYLRAVDIDAFTGSMMDLPSAAQSLESRVAQIPPQVIGYTALSRAREISRLAQEFTGHVRELKVQTRELAKRTKP